MSETTEKAAPWLILGLLALAAFAFAGGMMGSSGAWPWWSVGWGWAMGLGMLAMMAIPVILLVFVVLALTQNRGPAPERRMEDARSIAERRYAQGEISREDFVRLRDDLARPR